MGLNSSPRHAAGPSMIFIGIGRVTVVSDLARLSVMMQSLAKHLRKN
jgi:hypothetical protein